MRKFRVLSLLFIATSFIATSCTKEGPEGPVGATGAQGPAGNPGAAGPAGPAGPSGGATYSAWYTTVAADWTATGTAPYGAVLLTNRAAPSITQAIIDNGLVLAYMKNWNHWTGSAAVAVANQVAQLPFLENVDAADTYDYVIPSAGNIRYIYKSLDPWNAAGLAGIQLRYVVLAGTTAGKNTTPTFEGFTSEQLKAMTYEQVLTTFNIPAEGGN